MKAGTYTTLTFALLSLTLFACAGAATTNADTNSSVADTALKPEIASAEPTLTPDFAADSSAPTLTPVFKAYCAALAKKDEAALRRIYSIDTLKTFEMDMKAEKISSLITFLEGTGVTRNICDVRNEVINGNRAVAEVHIDEYPNGIRVVFVKENGVWKMTNKSPSVDDEPVSLLAEAQREAERYWNRFIFQCGESDFMYSHRPADPKAASAYYDKPLDIYYEMRNLRVSTDGSSPTYRNEADRLNEQYSPTGIEWSGKTSIFASTRRIYLSQDTPDGFTSEGWNKWRQESDALFSVGLSKRKGKWAIDEGQGASRFPSENYKKANCQQIPK